MPAKEWGRVEVVQSLMHDVVNGARNVVLWMQ